MAPDRCPSHAWLSFEDRVSLHNLPRLTWTDEVLRRGIVRTLDAGAWPVEAHGLTSDSLPGDFVPLRASARDDLHLVAAEVGDGLAYLGLAGGHLTCNIAASTVEAAQAILGRVREVFPEREQDPDTQAVMVTIWHWSSSSGPGSRRRSLGVVGAAHELGKKAYELDWAIWEYQRNPARAQASAGWEVIGAIEVDAAACGFGDAARLPDDFGLEVGMVEPTPLRVPDHHAVGIPFIACLTMEDVGLPIEVLRDPDGQPVAARMCLTNDVDEMDGRWVPAGELDITAGEALAADPYHSPHLLYRRRFALRSCRYTAEGFESHDEEGGDILGLPIRLVADGPDQEQPDA